MAGGRGTSSQLTWELLDASFVWNSASSDGKSLFCQFISSTIVATSSRIPDGGTKYVPYTRSSVNAELGEAGVSANRMSSVSHGGSQI